MKEQLYNDFVANMLPKLQEGMTITYEYFIDLFGRYVTYLFITDIIEAVLALVILITTVLVLLSKKYKVWRSEQDDDYSPLGWITLFLLIGLALLSFFWSLSSVFDAIKAKYIPEVRVYEQIEHIRSMNDNS